MLIRYLGHSFFVLTSADGTVLATDPYGVFYAYPRRRVRADVCTVSHHHHDHAGLGCLEGGCEVVASEGVWRPAPGVRVLGVPTWHDDREGALRGPNLFFVIEVDGLRVGHAGDLGHLPDSRLLERVGRLDVLMLPVGGYYTIDAKTALEARALLKPALTIPMHYRTRYNEDMPIAPLEDFLALAGERPDPAPLLRLTREDIGRRPGLAVLEIAP